MKAISIRPQWAWAIMYAGKDIENRTWKTKIRGTIAVHASQTMSRGDYEWALEKIKEIRPRAKVPAYEAMVRGAIIGLVDVVGCQERTKSDWHFRGNYGHGSDGSTCWCRCGRSGTAPEVEGPNCLAEHPRRSSRDRPTAFLRWVQGRRKQPLATLRRVLVVFSTTDASLGLRSKDQTTTASNLRR
jgi:hypothetical protein